MTVLKADEMTLAHGLEYERRLSDSLLATKDQKEGMNGFLQRRKATLKGW